MYECNTIKALLRMVADVTPRREKTHTKSIADFEVVFVACNVNEMHLVSNDRMEK